MAVRALSRSLGRRHSPAAVFLVLGIGLIVALLIATGIGAVSVSPLDILGMLAHKILPMLNIDPTWVDTDETIILQLRLPRVVGGMLVGAALATAGVLFQGLLRNPMADPYIIGTSGGAAFGATLAMMLPFSAAFLGFGLVPVAAFCGGLGAVLLVYNLARVGSRTPVISMLLAGFVVSSVMAALMSLLMAVSGRLQIQLHSVFSFLMGGISISTWWQIAIIAPLIVGGIVLARFMAFRLNAFALGEEGAAHLGVDVERSKLSILALGSLLTAAAVSISGLVGFVGLVMPHAVRLVLGPDHRLLLPASALVGGIFLVMADLLARSVVAPTELPVGIVTALVGAPFFLYLLRRMRKEYAF